MSGYLRVDKFIDSVKKRAAVPTSQVTFTDEDIIRFANEDLEENMIPLIMAVREEFFVESETYTPTVVNNNKRLEVPERAIGTKVRLINPISNGVVQPPLSLIPLEHVEYSSGGGSDRGYYMKGNFIYLLISSEQVVVSYYQRPNEVVLLERAAQIEAIDRDTGIIEVDDVPSIIEAGSIIDFNQTKPGHRVYAKDVTVATVNQLTNQISFSLADIPDDLIVGDYICLAGETVIPQIPSDLHNMLAQATACKILESINDEKGLKNATRRLEKMETKLLNLIESRAESKGKKIANIESLLYRNRLSFGKRI